MRRKTFDAHPAGRVILFGRNIGQRQKCELLRDCQRHVAGHPCLPASIWSGAVRSAACATFSAHPPSAARCFNIFNTGDRDVSVCKRQGNRRHLPERLGFHVDFAPTAPIWRAPSLPVDGMGWVGESREVGLMRGRRLCADYRIRESRLRKHFPWFRRSSCGYRTTDLPVV